MRLIDVGFPHTLCVVRLKPKPSGAGSRIKRSLIGFYCWLVLAAFISCAASSFTPHGSKPVATKKSSDKSGK
jgi:hypothetical protein